MKYLLVTMREDKFLRMPRKLYYREIKEKLGKISSSLRKEQGRGGRRKMKGRRAYRET